jgi:hypothetical protein
MDSIKAKTGIKTGQPSKGKFFMIFGAPEASPGA